MTLFHFFSFPLFAVLLVAIDFRRNEDNKKLAGYFIKGMALYIPAFVVFLLFKAWISVSYNPIYMYLRVFFLDHFFYFIVVIAGFILIQGLDNLERVEFLQLAVFSTGFYAVAGVEAILQNTGVYNMYLLFFLPLFWLFLAGQSVFGVVELLLDLLLGVVDLLLDLLLGVSDLLLGFLLGVSDLLLGFLLGSVDLLFGFLLDGIGLLFDIFFGFGHFFPSGLPGRLGTSLD